MSNKNREELSEEEIKRNKFTQNVLDQHEASTRSASISSNRANRAKMLIKNTVKSALLTVQIFPNEIQNFDEEMIELKEREEARLEREEKIKANAGKDLDYFVLPTCAKRINYSRFGSAADV